MDQDSPRFVVLHHDASNVLALKRQLEASGVRAVGARSIENAVQRVREGDVAAVIVPWAFPDLGAMELVWALENAGLKAPYLMTYSAKWNVDDAARALQLAYDAFFGSPVTAPGILREFAALRTNGTAPSRQKMTEMGGPRLLEPNPLLWSVTDDPAWRSRMVELAARASQRVARRADLAATLLVALDHAAGEPVCAKVVDAVRRVVCGREVDIPGLAREAGIGATLLDHLAATVRPLLQPDGRPLPDGGEAMMEAAERAGKRGQGEGTDAFLALRKQASSLLGGGAVEEFVEAACMALRIPVSQAKGIPKEKMRRAAGHLLGNSDEHAALAHVRLAMMSEVLGRVAENGAEPGDLDALGALLQSGDPYADEIVGGVVVAASHEGDPGTCRLLSSSAVDAVTSELGRVVSMGGDASGAAHNLLERLNLVAEAAQAGGDVDRRRIRYLLDAVERGERVTLSTAAVDSLQRMMTVPEGERDALVQHLCGELQIASEAHAARTAQLVAASGRMDSGMLQAAARAALHADGLARLRAELADAPPPPPTPLERATAMAELQRAAAEVGVQLPYPVPTELVERYLAGKGEREGALRMVLEFAEGPAAQSAVDRWLERGAEPEAVYEVLKGLDPGSSAATHARARLGLPEATPVHEDVVALVRAGNYQGAVVAACALDEDHPRTVPVLNQLGVLLQKSGRTELAAEVYERALRLQPNRIPTQLNLARLKLALKRPEEAKPLLANIRKVAPGFGDSEQLWQEMRLAG